MGCTLSPAMQRISIERFTVLIQAAAAVAGQIELRSVLKTTVEMAVETTGARYGAIGVIGDHGTLVDFIYTGMSPEDARAIGPPPIGKGVLGALIDHPEPIRLAQITDHPASSGFPDNHPPMGAFLGVPVRAGEQVFGNLYLTEKEGGFDDTDEQLVIALSAVAGGAVAAARLHDRLTRVALAEDRERIARDLHDSVIQDLFATGLGLQGLSMSIDDAQAVQRLDDAIERIDNAISSLRSFIFDIRSFAATIADPERTIRRMVERLVADRAIEVTVEIGTIGACAPELLDDALGVIREAVSNAVRHSAASTLTVRVDTTDHGLTIMVRDNGCGFEPTTVERGMGLDNLQARATTRAGSIRIESAVGVGTTVTTVFPE
jgi:signal transduction histidine kinase